MKYLGKKNYQISSLVIIDKINRNSYFAKENLFFCSILKHDFSVSG